MKSIPINKQSKKAQREYNKMRRSLADFNLGLRTMATDKNPSRARRKVLDRALIREYN